MNSELLDFAAKIRRTDDLAVSWNCLLSELKELGFIHAKYGVLVAPPSRFRQAEVLLVGEFCSEWEQAQQDTHWAEHDYIVDHLINADKPLTFSSVYRKMDAGRLTKQQAKNHSLGRDVGMQHGVALPLKDGRPMIVGGISMEADRSFTPKEFRGHLGSVMKKLTDRVEIFHSNVNRPELLSESQLPSKRETECLVWAMRGYRVQQIGDKLGTHPKTVEKQLASVRRKLRARTNAQAVTRALLLDLITP